MAVETIADVRRYIQERGPGEVAAKIGALMARENAHRGSVNVQLDSSGNCAVTFGNETAVGFEMTEADIIACVRFLEAAD